MPRVVATDLMPEFSGKSISNGRFVLDLKLGSGAYGKVYRASDTSTATSSGGPTFYAIKVLHRHPEGSAKEKSQHNEFRIHARVSSHINIVTLHDYFKDLLYAYAILDLCSGGDLFLAITEKSWYRDQPERIKHTFLQIIDAVQHCHDAGIFHRDIKPENILCSEDGTHIRLSDFGLSTRNIFSGEYGCGSSFYMSPECIGNKETPSIHYSTRHNDIWALGVILTNMSTGRNPWKLATVDDDCFRAFQRDPDFLKGCLPISTELNNLLKRIFVLDWNLRIALPALRKRIVELEEMFDSPGMAKGKVRPATPGVKTRRVAVSPEIPKAEQPEISPQEDGDAEEYQEFRYDDVYNAPDPGAEPDLGVVSLSSSATIYFSGELIPERSSLNPPAGPTRQMAKSSASSGSDSKGPITPASPLKAVKADVGVANDVPEFRLDDPGNGTGQEVADVASPTEKAKRPMRGSQFLRSAIQRLKG